LTPSDDNLAATPDSEPELTASLPGTMVAATDVPAPRADVGVPEPEGPNEEPEPPEDSPEPVVIKPEAPLLPPPTPGRMLGYALLCGFVGFLFSLRAFAAATLPHILTQDGLNFQGVQEGLPIPRLLDWDPTQIGLLQQYTTLHPALLVSGALLLGGFLWTRTLRALFPALRLLRPHTLPNLDGETPNSPPHVSAVALDGRMLLRLSALGVLVALPLAALGGLEILAYTRSPKLEIPLQVVWFLFAGIWLRGALRPHGFVARSLFSAEFVFPRRPFYALPIEIGIGALLGLSVFLLQRSAMPLPAPNVLRSMHALGLFHLGRWHALGLHYLLSIGLVCFGAALLLLVFLAMPTLPQAASRRLAPAGLALLCIPLTLWLARPYTSRSLAASWDITPAIMLETMPYNPQNPMSGIPDGAELAQELAHRTGITAGSRPNSPDRRFLLFTQAGAFDGVLHGYTEDGMTADLASVPKVQKFLQSRDYNTTLSWTAFKHNFNVGNVHFDSTLALRACLDDLEHHPHSVVTNTVEEMLFTVAASPQNLALVNEWADGGHFDAADRATLKLLGDLYLRFGEQQKALEWYTRADMPRSFMADIRAHKPLFHAGQIQGTLLWNGKPLVGAQVGAFPFLQNGLPKNLEGPVRDAERQLMPGYTFSDLFGPMEPRPYQLRWMSAGATTDNLGHFSLNSLTEGTYHLICTLPPDVVLKPFRDDRLHILKPPGDISVRYAKPTKDLGAIDMTFHP